MIQFLKECVNALAGPLVLALLLAVLAYVARLFARRRVAQTLVIASVSIAYLGAISPVADALLGPLERRYPGLDDGKLPSMVSYVVVLGSGYVPRPGVPITGALDEDGLARGVEGVRLMRALHAGHLVLSGGAKQDWARPAAGYSVLARSLGVDPSALIVRGESLDTYDEARAIAGLVGTEPFVLVTSAYHMPRAVMLFERMGAHPVPAPTGQRVTPSEHFDIRRWLPNASALHKSERALHEYLGLLAGRAGVG